MSSVNKRIEYSKFMEQKPYKTIQQILNVVNADTATYTILLNKTKLSDKI